MTFDPLSQSGLMLPPKPAALMTQPELGLKREILANTPAMMLVRHQMSKGWRGARDRHPHEQMVYVIRGRIRIKVESSWCEAAEGDNFIVTSNAEHEAEALEDSVVLDIFTPTREDYL